MVNSRYFPSRGTANEVGGIISASSRKNTVSDTRIEMHSVTCHEFKDQFHNNVLYDVWALKLPSLRSLRASKTRES